MNKARYEALPDDLKAVLDANSGLAASKWVGVVMDKGDLPGIEAAKKAGNKMITLDEAEVVRWKAAAAPLVQAWIDEMNAKGYDGAALVADAKALIAEYAGDRKSTRLNFQSLMRISYAVFCLKKKNTYYLIINNHICT